MPPWTSRFCTETKFWPKTNQNLWSNMTKMIVAGVLGVVWRLFGACLEGVGGCLEACLVWKVSGGLRKVSVWCLVGVCRKECNSNGRRSLIIGKIHCSHRHICIAFRELSLPASDLSPPPSPWSKTGEKTKVCLRVPSFYIFTLSIVANLATRWRSQGCKFGHWLPTWRQS